MDEPVTIVLLGDAKAFAHRQTKSGRRYVPNQQRHYAEAIGEAAEDAMQGRPPFAGALAMTLYIERALLKGFSKAQRTSAILGELLPITKPDNKNYLSLAEDALKGVVWGDDSQVCKHAIEKRYGVQPKLVITVAPLTARQIWR